MSPHTRAAVAAILDTDTGLSAAHRLAILTACDKPTEAAAAAPGAEIPARDAAHILGKSLSTILRWMESGELQGRKIGKRLTVVSCESVEAIRARLASRSVAPLPDRFDAKDHLEALESKSPRKSPRK